MPQALSFYAGQEEDAFLNAERDKLKEIRAEERKLKPWNGLALSGGGIRSATFCLGALQALASKDLLKHFDYLSTVSGGGHWPRQAVTYRGTFVV